MRPADSVELEGRAVALDLPDRRLQVAIVPGGATDPAPVVRRGRDLKLLAGLQLLRKAEPPAFNWLPLPSAIAIPGNRTPSLSNLASLARTTGLPIVIGWTKSGALTLGQLLRHAPAAIELLAKP